MRLEVVGGVYGEVRPVTPRLDRPKPLVGVDVGRLRASLMWIMVQVLLDAVHIIALLTQALAVTAQACLVGVAHRQGTCRTGSGAFFQLARLNWDEAGWHRQTEYT
jgi:cobalamin synthase